MIGVSQSASPGFGFLRQLLLSLRPGGKLWEAPGTKEGPGELLGSSLAAFHVPLRSPAAHALTTERHGLLPLCLDSIFILFPVFLLLQQASRAQILDKATEYIQYMRRKNHTHQQDIDDLKRQNALLEQQGELLDLWGAWPCHALVSQGFHTWACRVQTVMELCSEAASALPCGAEELSTGRPEETVEARQLARADLDLSPPRGSGVHLW